MATTLREDSDKDDSNDDDDEYGPLARLLSFKTQLACAVPVRPLRGPIKLEATAEKNQHIHSLIEASNGIVEPSHVLKLFKPAYKSG